MDSKNIYISYQHYSNEIEWEMHEDSEWIYVGADDEFKKEKATELIDSFFEESAIYFITDRRNSALIEKNTAISKIMEAIEEFDPALANADFSKIMEFDKIGVVRKGKRIN
ncbi:hypothetical protein AAE02nite_01850 [Adhaeribacter aerolatus]|uniref:Uncharacterized protein n=2 Tax=Adhaeribacter aerolatus TaxID=670289 RepID=A0A512AS38_9BACT|nr:hypothetical protein AAE02nite_01850 [Adhaeribacter aerolatus]